MASWLLNFPTVIRRKSDQYADPLIEMEDSSLDEFKWATPHSLLVEWEHPGCRVRGRKAEECLGEWRPWEDHALVKEAMARNL